MSISWALNKGIDFCKAFLWSKQTQFSVSCYQETFVYRNTYTFLNMHYLCLYLAVLSVMWAFKTRDAMVVPRDDGDGVFMWIDPQQAQDLSGGDDYYLVRDDGIGELVTGLNRRSKTHPVPSDMTSFNVTWHAPPETNYMIQVRSYTQKVMKTPVLDIPHKGDIPQTNSSFSIELPCVSTGNAAFMIAVQITNTYSRHTPVSPVVLELRKGCLML